jgi:hypothetical protein
MKDEEQKLKEYEVQYSVRWVNFTTTVQAVSEREAIKLAGVRGLKDFTIKTNNEEVNSIEDIFEHSQRWGARAECLDEEEIDEEEDDPR